MRKRTKIVCTIGPASESKEMIKKLIQAGMNVARLNFSHGTHASHAMLIKNLRAVAKELGEPLAILADLQGPRLRVGDLPEQGVKLKKGEKVKLDCLGGKYRLGVIPVNYPQLKEDVKIGHRLLFDDGKIEMTVTGFSGQAVEAEVRYGGTLTSHKGMNFPDSALSVSSLSKKDKEDLQFIVSQNVDWLALSFVRTAKDILDLRFLVKEYEKKAGLPATPPLRIVSKIEKREALDNLDEILGVTDGVMVARGDLGLEMPMEDVPLWQKRIIDKCLSAAKPVIVATQMLDSMVHSARPTRAEVSDVANAVIDHTDAIMLSAETASGDYPVEAVATMAKIAIKSESSVYDDLPFAAEREGKKDESLDRVISQLGRFMADKIKARAILAASLSGDSGREVACYRPQLPIYVATDSERVCRQLNLTWGVVPFILPACRTIEELTERSMSYLKKKKEFKKGDQVIVIAGEPVGRPGNVNLVEVKEVK